MDFIPARDFRVKPAAVWKKLRKNNRVVITSNGKPVAIMKDIEGRDLEEEWKTESMADGMAALSRMREKARRDGTSGITMEEIDREIAQARKKS